MIRIGEFAILSGVSIKALRFYDETGIFHPAHVDPQSGYRYYAGEQLPTIRRIAVLRDLGVPLREIALTVAEPGAFSECLIARRRELANGIRQAKTQITSIDRLLSDDELETPVISRRVESFQAASLRASLKAYSDFDPLLDELSARVPQKAVSGRGSIWHQCESAGGATLDCEAFVSLRRDIEPRGALRVTRLPAHTVGSAFYHGSNFAPAYRAISRWLASMGMREAGPKREIYLTAEVTEVQIPIEC